ncbi:unnamed protein product [Nippostrongylus brasiliensis]|uniref:Nondiscriminating glutamyl-tRNA synthetase EARS2, mitochondrial n=1 Tax=Nippostrongylus brasiliensis TaxID=27835 RepID=A0A0N4XTY7_NIPBR|nr:unnamed protein product [Nippostrongylus brasiliensis]
MLHIWHRSFCSLREVRVRFAPSPTGALHLGGLRTALFNYLFARHHKGSFILRIEDTDQARLVPGSVAGIERVLNYYGLNYDEGPGKGSYGPYYQSERLPFYRDATEQLLDSGHAYRCFCSEDRLALLRKDALRRNEIPNYDRKCRSLSEEESRSRAEAGEPFVVRFKLDKQNVSFEDDVFGAIEQCIDESDMVLVKADGFPTYHLANVVDDKAMCISHVIRGQEWLSSTGKHVILYKTLGWTLPRWIHLPLITRDGRKKLSKRDKDAVADYYEQELGVLPDAVLNSLIRNGSGIQGFDPDHLYSLEEMVANFDEKCIGKRNLQFDMEILQKYGRMAFQKADFEQDLLPALRNMIGRDLPSIEIPQDSYLQKIVEFLKTNEENFAFLSSLTKGDFRWFLTKPSDGERLLSMFDRESALTALTWLREVESLDVEELKKLAEQHGWQYPKFLALIRVTLIDSKSGPPIKELVDFFGLDECRKRFNDMIQRLDLKQNQTCTG